MGRLIDVITAPITIPIWAGAAIALAWLSRDLEEEDEGDGDSV